MGWIMGLEPTIFRATIWRLSQLGHIHHMYFSELVRQEGLEPPTYCLEGSCSIQLSYWRIKCGAGDGNRTRVSSLEGWCSTIELHPHSSASRIQLDDFSMDSSVCQELFGKFSSCKLRLSRCPCNTATPPSSRWRNSNVYRICILFPA